MSGRPLILALDRNQQNLRLLGQFLDKQGYETLPLSTLEDFESAVNRSDQFALALIDISGFDRRIWGCCELLSEKGVPLLVISPQQVPRIQDESLAHGAQGVLVKPLSMPEFISVIKSLIRSIKDD